MPKSQKKSSYQGRGDRATSERRQVSTARMENVFVEFRALTERFLTCPTCLSTYNTTDHPAKLLPCGHSVCLPCLEQIGSHVLPGRNPECPECRREFDVPDHGFGGLSPSFLVNSLLDLGNETKRTVETKCSRHQSGPALMYCQDCDERICVLCEDGDAGAHAGRSHQVIPYDTALECIRKTIEFKILVANYKLDSSSGRVRQEIQKLEHCAQNVASQIESTLDELTRTLEMRRSTLLSDLEVTYSKKKESLLEQLQKIESQRNILETDTRPRETDDIKQLCERLEKVNCTVGAIGCVEFPQENYFISFSPEWNCSGVDVSEKIRQLGEVKTSNTSASECQLKIGDIVARIGGTVLLRAFDSDGIPRSSGGDPISAELRLTGHGNQEEEVVPVEIVDHKDGFYELKFRPRRKGKFHLVVNVLGYPIKGCPFEILVSDNINPDTVYGKHGNGSEHFNKPIAVVSGKDGHLYVLDAGNCRIKVLSFDLRFIRHIENVGLEDGAASALAVTPTGSFLTGNRKTRIVTEFNSQGRVLRTFTHKELREPSGIAVDSEDNMYIVDTNQRCIFLFNSDGEMIRKITKKYLGLTTERSFIPFAVCITEDGKVLIAGEEILILDKSRSWLIDKISLDSEMNGHFSGLCHDKKGAIFATHTGGGKEYVVMYDLTKKSIELEITSRKSPLSKPTGVLSLPSGHVIVVDTSNHCLKKYRYT